VGRATQSATTDEEGRFHFERVPAGAANLTVDVLGSIDRAKKSFEVPAGVEALALRFDYSPRKATDRERNAKAVEALTPRDLARLADVGTRVERATYEDQPNGSAVGTVTVNGPAQFTIGDVLRKPLPPFEAK